MRPCLVGDLSLLFFAMTMTPPFVFGKPRNLKGFKSQGMVVCAVQTLEEGKVGR